MSEQNDGSVEPPPLPVTSPAYMPPAPVSEKPRLGGWKIATAVLALTTVIALVWGFVQANNLRSEVDWLQSTLKQEEADSQAAVEAAGASAEAQINALNEQVVGLSAELETLEKEAEGALQGVAAEYSKLKKELAKTERAAADMKAEQEKDPADSAAIAAAYEETLTKLYATQDAMAELLTALLVEPAEVPGF